MVDENKNRQFLHKTRLKACLTDFSYQSIGTKSKYQLKKIWSKTRRVPKYCHTYVCFVAHVKVANMTLSTVKKDAKQLVLRVF